MAQLNFLIVGPDDSRLRRWETALTRQGWPVSTYSRYEELMADAVEKRFGVAMIDWDTLKARTPDAVKRLKKRVQGVSIVLTSSPELSAEKVIEVLEAGADDHFSTSTDDRLLVAKLRAHMRRILPALSSALDVLKSPGGEVKIDRSRQEAWVKGARGKWATVADLTPTEFEFLSLFLERPGKVLERAFILETVWKGRFDGIRPGTVDKHIESLRKKLGKFGAMIRTVYGVGYAFRDN